VTADRDKAGTRLHKPNISSFYATKCSTLNEAALVNTGEVFHIARKAIKSLNNYDIE
jgi:hypothetical protein